MYRMRRWPGRSVNIYVLTDGPRPQCDPIQLDMQRWLLCGASQCFLCPYVHAGNPKAINLAILVSLAAGRSNVANCMLALPQLASAALAARRLQHATRTAPTRLCPTTHATRDTTWPRPPPTAAVCAEMFAPLYTPRWLLTWPNSCVVQHACPPSRFRATPHVALTARPPTSPTRSDTHAYPATTWSRPPSTAKVRKLGQSFRFPFIRQFQCLRNAGHVSYCIAACVPGMADPTLGVCGPNGTSKGVVTGSYTCLPGYYKSGFPEFCSRM
jgi:hypothetical protein